MPSGSGWPRSAMSRFLPFAAESASANSARADRRAGREAGGRRRTGSLLSHEANCGAFCRPRSSTTASLKANVRLPVPYSPDRHSRSAARSAAALPALVLALPPLYWVIEAKRNASLHRARARPGHLPVRRVGDRARGDGLPRRPRRQRPAHPHGAHGVPRARRTRRAPVPRARPSRHGGDLRLHRRVPARGARQGRASALIERVAWGLRGVGRAARPVPALHLLGPRAARELLRLVPVP